MIDRWDNITILRAIDQKQVDLYHGGHLSGYNAMMLMNEIAGAYTTDEKLHPGFLQELRIARDAGLLTFRVQDYSPGHSPNPNGPAQQFLQQVIDIALTVEGQDRARGQVIVQTLPDPDEDDGRLISKPILRQVASAITDEYDVADIQAFLEDCGLPVGRPPLLADAAGDDPYAVLMALSRGGSEGRRLLRRFLGQWMDNQFLSGPDDDLRARLVEQFARRGRHVEGGNLVVGESSAEVRSGSPLLRDARLNALHPDVNGAAARYVRDGHPAVGVFEAIKALAERVRQMSGSTVDGSRLINSVFSDANPLLVVADVGTETGRNVQNGFRLLAAGAVQALRNPSAHAQFGNLTDAETFEQLGLLSLLMRHLDNARKP